MEQTTKSWLSPFGVGLVVLCLTAMGCVTQGQFRKLEERVIDSERANRKGPDPFSRIAALSAEVETLKAEQRRLQGELEMARKTADDALVEAQKARETLASQSALAGAGAASAAGAAGAGGEVPDRPAEAEDGTSSAEVTAYQEALAAWRSDDLKSCVDLFRKFLQAYPKSVYADDGAYWMADCHFKQGDYRVAVLRFNDVVRVYPNGNKAADALYRQGESLLKLGPGFYDAARTVFKQVLEDYPDSDRARAAKEQLEAIGRDG
ncbi:MAG: tol-pal system protein YbgF [Myxococcota bacterium]|nr:tol-pal system protein YbgF [Myxococcota bacterium]